MSNKKNNKIVYSTNPDFSFGQEETIQQESIAPEKQTLYLSLDKKQRKGKKVTLITGFHLSETDLKQLAKDLKVQCGAGGTAKNNEIILQGDFRPKVKDFLEKRKFKVKLTGG